MLLTVYAKPNSRSDELTKIIDESTIKVSIKEIPEKGKANLALLNFLAKEFSITKNDLEIIRGKGTRIKQIKVPEKVINELKKRLK